tara:strand:+ start:3158 stop:3850 length:693 start_codon:yes stop_codon:yes gene_type:complete
MSLDSINFYQEYLDNPKYGRPTPEDIMCEVQLNSLPGWEKLVKVFNEDEFLAQLAPYQEQFVPYLPRPGRTNHREGLLLSGLEGDSPNVSLSMPEARTRTGNSKLKESEFCYPTQFYHDMKCLQPVLDYFQPLGRTYIVKAYGGSYFPSHKDHPLISRDCFRIVAFCGNVENYRWELEGQPIPVQRGGWYYVDTRKTHQTFQMLEPSYHLIANIPKTWDNILKLMSILPA